MSSHGVQSTYVAYDYKQLKEVVMELKGLGCPVWKIARLLHISEQEVVRLAGIEEVYWYKK